MWIEDMYPRKGGLKIDLFTPSKGTADTDSVQTWKKPFGSKFIYFYVAGAGGGGGRPPNGSITYASSGGQSGGFVSSIIPAFQVPDILYVKPGIGGLGATTANTVGGDGTNSSVFANLPLTWGTVPSNALFYASGGIGGRTNNGVTGGVGSSIFRWSLGSSYALSTSSQGGGASILNGTPSNVTFSGGKLFFIGTGGGNGTGSGGSIVLSQTYGTLTGGAGTIGENGKNGINYNSKIPLSIITGTNANLPVFFSGGTGGGGHTNGQAGSGGHGAWGSGGGGGGSCTDPAGISGNGGNGGDGFIIIASY